MVDRYELTDKAIAELRRLKGEGKSFSEIAAALRGPSRNACIGKARRLGIVSTKPAAPSAKPARSARPPREPKPRPAKPPKVVAIKPEPPPPPPRLPDDRKGVPFLDWRPGQCRWPLWNRNTPFEAKEICGEPVMPGRSYCRACNDVSVA
ncbi:MAG: GcrA family cell cycle regulator, partial [Beijerinckiaceae bacterium]|nr:GcrA family cell cycle regulator [Beijerinckiaceae bacterium]